MKKSVKIIIIVASVLVVAILALVGVGFAYLHGYPVSHKGMKYADRYRSDSLGDCVYFTESDFGDYESESFSVKDTKGLFRCVGSMYTVTYSDEQYAKQIAEINAKEFIDESDCKEGTNLYGIFPATQVEENGWLVRILETEDKDISPKVVSMILTNDEEKTIVYMHFKDPDLDYIEGTDESGLIDFIEKYFNFKFD